MTCVRLSDTSRRLKLFGSSLAIALHVPLLDLCPLWSLMPEIPEVLVWERLIKRRRFRRLLCVSTIYSSQLTIDIDVIHTSLPSNFSPDVFTGVQKTRIRDTYGQSKDLHSAGSITTTTSMGLFSTCSLWFRFLAASILAKPSREQKLGLLAWWHTTWSAYLCPSGKVACRCMWLRELIPFLYCKPFKVELNPEIKKYSTLWW